MNCSRTCPTEAHVGTQMSEAVGWDVSQSLTCLVERPYDFGLCWCMNGSNILLYPVPASWSCVMFCHRPVRTGVFLLLRTQLLCATSKNRQLWKSPQHDSLEVVVLKQLMLFVIWYVMIIALFPLKKSLVVIVVQIQNCSSFAPCLFTTPLHSVLSQAFPACTTDCMFLRDWWFESVFVEHGPLALKHCQAVCASSPGAILSASLYADWYPGHLSAAGPLHWVPCQVRWKPVTGNKQGEGAF